MIPRFSIYSILLVSVVFSVSASIISIQHQVGECRDWGKNCTNFGRFLYHNFWLGEKVFIQIVSAERSFSDLSELTLSYAGKIFLYLKRKYLGEKMRCISSFIWKVVILPKYSDFVNSDDCNGKISSRSVWSKYKNARYMWRSCKISPHFTCSNN